MNFKDFLKEHSIEERTMTIQGKVESFIRTTGIKYEVSKTDKTTLFTLEGPGKYSVVVSNNGNVELLKGTTIVGDILNKIGYDISKDLSKILEDEGLI